jgi:hypothetical protein
MPDMSTKRGTMNMIWIAIKWRVWNLLFDRTEFPNWINDPLTELAWFFDSTTEELNALDDWEGS